MEQILVNLQFPDQFVKSIMCCMKTVSYSILINGVPTPPFAAKKGLRQGDPMSPYLFVLAMEYLSRLLKSLKQERGLKYHLKCGNMKITQLSFADDLLLFSRWDNSSIHAMFQCFKTFSLASGLHANLQKSSIFFGGVSMTVQW
ncbi:uncharacterized mitochondrial protein AtMg01250-like [Lycium ferocissimum]|uniref:uncharacterized mitochondrial protein AtMg01250-like n=1 Tax=Lycium ferocissimum TaxID=112874 RepID=UPI00281669CB|nr:uncharacterized mitochondrial protein AtMg01250-like [Lycium ferocissimum]